MAKVAVIQRVAEIAGNFADAAPGHRFNLYFPLWRDNWSIDKNGKTAALKATTAVSPEVGKLLGALRQRQQAMASNCPDVFTIAAISTAPFATGLGNEHPIENGFSFLTPYGLPYLAGSGIKGVLRRAAEEIALFPEEYRDDTLTPNPLPEGEGLTMLEVWWLFGFEGAAGAWWPPTRKEERELSDEKKARRARFKHRFGTHLETLVNRPDLPYFIKRAYPKPKEHAPLLADPEKFLREFDSRRQNIHTRGALDFWDVFPQTPRQGPYKDKLAVEIMTPHYGDYYQAKTSLAYPKGATPHDAGQPNPIPFLAVPADSAFDFHVVCQSGFLPEPLRERWKPMLQTIFHHAFDWLGFGAKTAVGYGVVRPLTEAELSAQAASKLHCEWVDETILEIATKNKVPDNKLDDVLRGKPLAEMWQALTDQDLKSRALADIKARWQAKGWWDNPPSGTAQKARAIYG